MSFSDYWKGPAHRQRAEALEAELAKLHAKCSQLQALITQIGAMDVVNVQNLVEQEKVRLAAVREETQRSEREMAALAQRSTDLQEQILIWEETVLLESFALYEPRFKLTTSQEYKARLDSVRDRQKVMIKNAQAATGNMQWTSTLR